MHTILKLAFEKAGYQVFAALDAMQGMMMAKQLRPDLVVLDMMMPAGGGSAVYERLQMMSGSFQVPFLIYSAMPGSEILLKIQESPTVKVFSKSARIDELVAAANELTGS